METNEPPEAHNRKVYWYKLCKQLCLVGAYISTGLLFEVVGPCIPDLKDRNDLDYEEISRALSGTSVGLIVAAITGGILHERFYAYTDLLLSFSMLVGAIGITLLPWMTSIWSLGFCFFCCGFEANFNNPGGMAMVLHLWGDKGGPAVYSLAFGFGLGGFIAPQIAKPFILDHINDDNQNFTLINGSDVSININDSSDYYNGSFINVTNSTSAKIYNTDLIYPFIIVGAVNFMFTLFFLMFFMAGPPKDLTMRKGAKNIKTLCSPQSCIDESNVYGLCLLVLLFCYYIHAVGGEHVYGKWIFSFALDTEVNFTKNQAANLSSLYWFCHMAGRGSGMLYSKWVPTKLVIFCNGIFAVTTGVLLCIFAHDTPIMLWILTGCMGFIVAITFPSGMLWSDIYLRVNSMSIMVCMIGASVGYFLYVYAGGYCFEYFGPRSLMFIQLTFGILYVVTFGLMELLVHCFSYKHKKNKKQTMEYIETESMVNYQNTVIVKEK